MSTETNKELTRRFIDEVFNKGNLDLIDEYVAEDYVDHAQGLQGRDAYKHVLAGIRHAFPDLHVTIEDMLAEDDRVAVRITATHTHEGEFMGIPPTGVHGAHTGITIVRLEDGKVVEAWEESDMLGVLSQIGAVEVAGSSQAAAGS